MTLAAHIDFETASPEDLVSSGVHRYVEHPDTRIWMLSWKVGDERGRWHPGDPDPLPLLLHVASGGTVVAHGAMFERHIWRMLCERAMKHWPLLRIEQQDCTMARAAAISLPQSLDEVAEVLSLKHRKDYEGSLLMRKMMRPRKRNPDGTYTWWDEPENLSRLGLYCDRDVEAEEEAESMLPPLTPSEREIWTIDQRINDRGVYVDIDAITRAVDLVEYAKKRANAKMRELTDGHVKSCTNVKDIVAWLNTRGVQCDSIRKGDQDELITFGQIAGDERVEQVIELRREASKTSTAKYGKVLDCVCEDGRVRGQFQYHGAGPGRWAGRLVQLQNLPRTDPDTETAMIEHVIRVLSTPMPATEAHDLIELAGYKVLPALSKGLRGAIMAERGNKLIGGDFSNIEGRLNAWFAGEAWKLEAFEAYDLGIGPDLYRVTAAELVGIAIELITKMQRQVMGKVPELALGYQGGVGAFVTMAYTQNPPVRAAAIADAVINAVSAEQWDKTAKEYSRAPDKSGESKTIGEWFLGEREWTAIKIVVRNWRAKNAKITEGWWELQDAALAAVSLPGSVQPVYGGKARYFCDTQWLYCALPSGRVIHYCQPFIREVYEERVFVNVPAGHVFADRNNRWCDTHDFFEHELDDLIRHGCEITKRIKNTVHFWGRDAETKRWREKALYGGLQCENIVQGAAACLLRNSMVNVERAGYPLILHAHDELLAEVAKEFGSAAAFQSLMAIKPAWAATVPVAVAAWEDERYVK